MHVMYILTLNKYNVSFINYLFIVTPNRLIHIISIHTYIYIHISQLMYI